MALDPGANRYVKHLRQIRVIQDYLVGRAERHCIPKVDNTNVDRSVAAIHATVLSCLKRQYRVSPYVLNLCDKMFDLFFRGNLIGQGFSSFLFILFAALLALPFSSYENPEWTCVPHA